jgi:hypothetical protein
MKYVKLFENFSQGLQPIDVSKPGEVVVVLHEEDSYAVALVKANSPEHTSLVKYIQEVQSKPNQNPESDNFYTFDQPGIAYIALDHNGDTRPLLVQERDETLKYPSWVTPNGEGNPQITSSTDFDTIEFSAFVLIRDKVLSTVGAGNPEVQTVDEFLNGGFFPRSR